MGLFEQMIDFLPQGTVLMVRVNLSEPMALEVRPLLLSDISVEPSVTGFYVALVLDEPLSLKLSISHAARIEQNLMRCKCHIYSMPQEQLLSLNSAYQRISQLLEHERVSHGGTVYDNIYFKDTDGVWRLLRTLRTRLYEPHRLVFEEHQRIIRDRTNSYIKPLPGLLDVFSENIETGRAISDLLLQNRNLEETVIQLTKLLEGSKLMVYRQRLEEFKQRLSGNYPEVGGRESWQEWIYKNSWLFGTQYGDPIAHPQIGFRSILDYLFPTPDGFVDILEIKRPTEEVIREDHSHSGAFMWSRQVNAAIGQVVNYLYEMERNSSIISETIRRELSLHLSAIKPRAFILVGQSDNWPDHKKEAFRRLNASLHGIEVLTYTELLKRAENLFKVYAD